MAMLFQPAPNMLSQRLPAFVAQNYDCHEWRHASAILSQDFPAEWADILGLLSDFRLRRSWITVGGGSKSRVAEALDGHLTARGWRERQFQTVIEIDRRRHNSPTHKVDCFRNGVALEIEWNNKDPFFDRDMNNFRLLFDLRAISVGIIITRSDDLQDVFNRLGRGSSYGMSTTHMGKLIPRVEGGSGGGCPILAFGIRPRSMWRTEHLGGLEIASEYMFINETPTFCGERVAPLGGFVDDCPAKSYRAKN